MIIEYPTDEILYLYIKVKLLFKLFYFANHQHYLLQYY